MNQDKINFLKNDFIFLLKHLAPDAKGSWGAMNGQQMVEHFVDVIKNASGKLKLPMVNEGEKLGKARNFMLSDRPFEENMKNPFISEKPPATKKATMQAAIEKLQQELNYFFNVFENNTSLTTQNPFFGDLNFNDNIHLLHKHARHHLRQFGLVK
jgi:hypothetical protein